MKGHDEAVRTILQMGKGELNISERRIKDLHKEIMYEEFPTEKEKVGIWKSQGNHVINYRDEKFDFVAPAEVPERMHGLVNWVNAEKAKIVAKKKDALHPIELAFEFHLRYLTIHPFYDGNGRTGRILTNLILISYGFPPVYINDNEKQFYYRYLADVQGYGADRYLLFELMADYLTRSLSIIADAIDGKEIEEPEDLDKKIQLLQRELSGFKDQNDAKTRFSKAVLLRIYEDWLSKMVVSAIQIAQKFTKFYSKSMHVVDISGVGVIFEKDDIHSSLNRFKVRIEASTELDSFPHDLEIITRLKGLIGDKIDEQENLDATGFIKIRFLDTRYQLSIGVFEEKINRVNPVKILERWLDQPITDAEISDITSKFGNSIFNNIDYRTKKYGLRK